MGPASNPSHGKRTIPGACPPPNHLGVQDPGDTLKQSAKGEVAPFRLRL